MAMGELQSFQGLNHGVCLSLGTPCLVVLKKNDRKTAILVAGVCLFVCSFVFFFGGGRGGLTQLHTHIYIYIYIHIYIYNPD